MSHVCIPHGVMCSDTCRSCMYRLFWHGPWLQTTQSQMSLFWDNTGIMLLWKHHFSKVSVESYFDKGVISAWGEDPEETRYYDSLPWLLMSDFYDSAHQDNRKEMTTLQVVLKMENQHVQVTRSNIQNLIRHPLQILEVNLASRMSGHSYLMIK